MLLPGKAFPGNKNNLFRETYISRRWIDTAIIQKAVETCAVTLPLDNLELHIIG